MLSMGQNIIYLNSKRFSYKNATFAEFCKIAVRLFLYSPEDGVIVHTEP